MTAAVEIEHLTKRFASLCALDGISLSVQPGEMVALLGASGSGKSTLMRHLPGFLAASSGQVRIFGETVQADGRVSPQIRQLRSQIGFVFQQFNLVNRLPVTTNVLSGLQLGIQVIRLNLVAQSADALFDGRSPEGP